MNIAASIFENILEFLPVTLVDANERGVFLRFGKFKKIANPGAHFTLPLMDKIIVIDVQPQALTIPDIPVQMSNKETWVIGSAVAYRIDDPKKYCIQTQEPDELLQNRVLSLIVEKLGAWKSKGLVESQIYKQLREDAPAFGIDIMEFRFIKMAPCKTYMLMGHHDVAPVTDIDE